MATLLCIAVILQLVFDLVISLAFVGCLRKLGDIEIKLLKNELTQEKYKMAKSTTGNIKEEM